MKRVFIGFCAACALSLGATPVAAEKNPSNVAAPKNADQGAQEPDFTDEAADQLGEELADAFAMYKELFPVDPLTQEQQARLPLAQKASRMILPDGAFGTVMRDTMKPMFEAIMGMVVEDPRMRLAQVSGVEQVDLEGLEDDVAQEALDILDPQYAERTEASVTVLTRMMEQLFEAMEPAYRDAMAEVLVTKFDEDELTQLLEFFNTDLGERYAQESFLAQYNPRMMGALEAMGPAFSQTVPSLLREFETLEKKFADARRFPDLSTSERRRLAQLLGRSQSELDALAPSAEEEAGKEGDVKT